MATSLQTACAIIPFLYGFAEYKFGKQTTSNTERLYELVPEYRGSPTYQAYLKKQKTKGTVITIIIGVIMLAVNVLSLVGASTFMSWSLMGSTDPNNPSYQVAEIIGLVLIISSFLVVYFTHKQTTKRFEYLIQFYSLPPQDRQASPRDKEKDLAILRGGLYYLCRDPQQFAFHHFCAGLLWTSQSWFTFLLLALLWPLQEISVIGKDRMWRKWFGIQVYEEYATNRGGQWFCTCMNKCNRRQCEKMETMQEQLSLNENNTNTTAAGGDAQA